MIRVTKPGGYVEILDIYFTLRGAGPILSKIYEAHNTSCLQRGVDMKIIPNLDKIIQSNQNTPIVYRDEKSYILGPNGGKVGRKSKDIVVEKESKYYIPNNSEDIDDREHTFHFFQKYVFEDIKYQNY
ncbi:hypothetical protein RhiirA5_479690 [Rhizophagus irregularis]|uniref:Uncharacterized protein n=1 Tax=Rhizophagus irregularis TaxID=588596 RepID=A0A2N0PL69_9GLOM|nr:hypothetical protein RhiirA5_479690 [Rhizophagus irregularis]PKC54082.1 hypothetical protein RhiirA1_508055 [Rhizophagus irregularis]